MNLSLVVKNYPLIASIFPLFLFPMSLNLNSNEEFWRDSRNKTRVKKFLHLLAKLYKVLKLNYFCYVSY